MQKAARTQRVLKINFIKIYTCIQETENH